MTACVHDFTASSGNVCRWTFLGAADADDTGVMAAAWRSQESAADTAEFAAFLGQIAPEADITVVDHRKPRVAMEMG